MTERDKYGPILRWQDERDSHLLATQGGIYPRADFEATASFTLTDYRLAPTPGNHEAKK